MLAQMNNSLDALRDAFSEEHYATGFELAVYLLMGGLIAIYIRFLYDRCSGSVSDTDSFTRVFPLLTMVTTAVITVVGSSLALSLGLVGALSIVRFRAAIKEPEELIYLFLCIGVGLCLGAGLPILALVMVVITSLFVMATHMMGTGRRRQNLLLTITGDADAHFKEVGKGPVAEIQSVVPITTIQRFEIENGEGQVRMVLRKASSHQTTEMIANLRAKFPDCQFSFVNLDAGI